MTILLFFTTSWICTGPYTVLATLPVTVVSPGVRVPASSGTPRVSSCAEDDDEDDVVDPPLVPVVAATGMVGSRALERQQGHQSGDGAGHGEDHPAHDADRFPSELERLEVDLPPRDPAPRSASNAAEIIPDGPHT